jgi:hypothetical protein
MQTSSNTGKNHLKQTKITTTKALNCGTGLINLILTLCFF